MPEGTVVATEAVSVAAHLDQLEAAIKEAHEVVDGIAPSGAEERAEQPQAPGAEAGLVRCQEQMQHLISRLADVRDRVGLL